MMESEIRTIFTEDGVDNYEIIDLIASGIASYVYRARCKRGRLKNRLIALKKISLEKSHSAPSTSLYQTLCHPSIVSLFSVFSTSNHRFQVLELCSGGSLSAFLAAHEHGVLNEGQTRTVLRSLVNALGYLKKSCIIHRNINPENVLLTEQCRIKLSNLDLAIRLPSQDHTAITLITRPEYIAPEFLSRRPYDFSIDLWSLGCLVFTCLAGRPPFQGPSTDEIFENILHGRYTMTKITSTLAANLISSLIQVDPTKRQDLSSVSHDAFLDPRLSDIPLTLSDAIPNPVKIPHSNSIPFRAPSSLKSKPIGSRPPLRELQNTDLRRILSDEISFGDRRVVSDPITQSGTVLDHSSRRYSSLNLPRSKVSFPRCSSDSENEPQKIRPPFLPTQRKSLVQEQSESDSSIDQLPVGTSRPVPLNTNFLTARAHKTINGQITVLPSRSLLVDFREGERRRGKSGTEVLVISPEGNEIRIYSAPHLSTPCCITEPVATHNVDTLPREYWALYNDAAGLTSRLKQRTPRMTLHEPTIKCTLMANTPQADVELLFSGPATGTTRRLIKNQSSTSAEDKDKARMRLRYSRQQHSLEIAQCLIGSQGEEWKKQTLSITSLSLSSETGLSKLTAEEIEGITHLARFMRVCEAVEAEVTDHGSEHDATFRPRSSTPESALSNSSLLKNPLIDNGPPGTRVVSGSRTLAQSFSMSSVDLKLAPRPRKFSAIHKSSQETEDYLQATNKKSLQELDYSTKAISLTADVTPSWYRDTLGTMELVSPGQLLQTRYIPSVGWCLRYDSKVSQGGRYKVMFLDGDVLDIDVDEEWVEHVSPPDQDGISKKQRCSIRESHLKRTLSERMKVFEEFVAMFDSADL